MFFLISILFSFLNIFCNNLEVGWHLQHPSIGFKKQTTVQQPLAWHWQVWDLAPKKGCGVKIAIIDGFVDANIFNQNLLCENCRKLPMVEKLLIFEQAPDATQKNLLCVNCVRVILSHIKKNSMLYHGVCDYALIKQLAPWAIIEPYNIFDLTGKSTDTILSNTIASINQANLYDLVCICCKVTRASANSQKKVCIHADSIPYIVAAAGNDGEKYAQVAYPACCLDVAFDVGAFDEHNQPCSFMQCEQNIGPKCIAPGANITCPVILYDTFIGHMHMSGTSCAAALLTGAIALVVAQFKDIFQPKHILQVLYTCTQKESAWQTKTLLGALDIRSALLCLHVLQKLLQNMPADIFFAKFDQFLATYLVINNAYLLSQHSCIEKFLQEIQTTDLSDCVITLAQLILKMHKKPFKKGSLKKSFDNNLLYLLKTNKSQSIAAQQSVILHPRVQYILENAKMRKKC